MGLLPPVARRARGTIALEGHDIAPLDEARPGGDPRQRDVDDLPGADRLARPADDRRRSRSSRRWSRIARGGSRAQRAAALAMLDAVGIADARAAARRSIRSSSPAACASAS